MSTEAGSDPPIDWLESRTQAKETMTEGKEELSLTEQGQFLFGRDHQDDGRAECRVEVLAAEHPVIIDQFRLLYYFFGFMPVGKSQ